MRIAGHYRGQVYMIYMEFRGAWFGYKGGGSVVWGKTTKTMS